MGCSQWVGLDVCPHKEVRDLYTRSQLLGQGKERREINKAEKVDAENQTFNADKFKNDTQKNSNNLRQMLRPLAHLEPATGDQRDPRRLLRGFPPGVWWSRAPSDALILTTRRRRRYSAGIIRFPLFLCRKANYERNSPRTSRLKQIGSHAILLTKGNIF